ncbi:MAG: molybdopterin-dependent oxidoreductase [Deltaproteobacteria bacterium]
MIDEKPQTVAIPPASNLPAVEDAEPILPAPAARETALPVENTVEIANAQVRKQLRRHTRRGFLGLGIGLAAGLGGFAWLTSRRELDEVPWPIRKVLEVNEQLARDFFSARRDSPEFAKNRVSPDRVNGDEGMDEDFDAAAWKLQVHGLASHDAPMELGLDAIRKLPRVEMTTELKCIEGWSAVVQWAGVRFSDFMKAYPPETLSGDPFSLDNPRDLPPYVSLATPGDGYYVGLDMQSALHPQTLLCYEMNGAALTDEHGAPLRLVIPMKYGIKNIKRIGSVRYTTLRPADYWAERGYDWYAGL